MEKMYIHKGTGCIDTKDGWGGSYPLEELEIRGLTPEECFREDEGTTLFEL